MEQDKGLNKFVDDLKAQRITEPTWTQKQRTNRPSYLSCGETITKDSEE